MENMLDRECWNLDMSFILWLQPRLIHYLNSCSNIIDLTHYSFTIRGVEKTQQDWINEMIVLCNYLSIWDNRLNDDYEDKMHYLCEIWTELISYMWW